MTVIFFPTSSRPPKGMTYIFSSFILFVSFASVVLSALTSDLFPSLSPFNSFIPAFIAFNFSFISFTSFIPLVSVFFFFEYSLSVSLFLFIICSPYSNSIFSVPPLLQNYYNTKIYLINFLLTIN